MPERQCLICEKTVYLHESAPHKATVWQSIGDYGSPVYESMDRDVFLEAVVCDDCLVQKQALIEEVVVRRTAEVLERRSPSLS